MLYQILSNLSNKLIVSFRRSATASSTFAALKSSLLRYNGPSSALSPRSSSVISHYHQHHHYYMCYCLCHLQLRHSLPQHLHHLRLAPGTQQMCASRRSTHNWKRQMEHNVHRRKTIPKLVYFHNPWNYLQTKINMLKLKLFWDSSFNQKEFIRGSKQVIVKVLIFEIKKNVS